MTLIPCKLPKVAVQADTDLGLTMTGLHRVVCLVPRCAFSYGPALKSDAQEQATRHRAAHRAAVPRTWIERDPEYDVYCQACGGHRRTFGTRTDAQAWLDDHLTRDHGLVSC